jgi:hypothetical protein
MSTAKFPATRACGAPSLDLPTQSCKIKAALVLHSIFFEVGNT